MTEIVRADDHDAIYTRVSDQWTAGRSVNVVRYPDDKWALTLHISCCGSALMWLSRDDIKRVRDSLTRLLEDPVTPLSKDVAA